MLPRVIPQACIWAYNYNSNCFSDNAQEVDIVGLGNTFLEMMRAKSESGIGKRQLVFIGSCFGGLVIIEVRLSLVPMNAGEYLDQSSETVSFFQ